MKTGLGLRGEILVALLAVTVFAIGLNTAVVWNLNVLLGRQTRIEDATRSVRLLGASLTSAPQGAAAERLLGAEPDLVGAVFYDAEGRETARTGNPPRSPMAGAAGDAALLAALRLGESAGEAERIGEISVARVVAPLGERTRPAGAVEAWLRVPLAPPAAARRHLQLLLLYVALDSVVVGLFGWYLVSRTVVRPVRRLWDGTRQVAAGDLTARVSVGGSNELAGLAREFNRMAEALSEKEAALARQVEELQAANASLAAAREEVIQSEKLASLGRLATGLAHELGNPIGAVTGYVSVLLRKRATDPSEDAEMLRRVDRELKRIDRIVRDLLDYARPRPGTPSRAAPVSLESVVGAALAIVRVQKAFESIAIETTFEPLPPVRVDGHRLQQVLINLLINAADAVEGAEHRRIDIEIAAAEFPPPPRERRRQGDPVPPSGPAAAIRVRDTGAGIAPENLAMLFEPFFTTKEPGRGTGLGLAIARSIIESSGGRLLVESRPGEGTTFSILLPREAATDAAPPAGPATAAAGE